MVLQDLQLCLDYLHLADTFIQSEFQMTTMEAIKTCYDKSQLA